MKVLFAHKRLKSFLFWKLGRQVSEELKQLAERCIETANGLLPVKPTDMSASMAVSYAEDLLREVANKLAALGSRSPQEEPMKVIEEMLARANHDAQMYGLEHHDQERKIRDMERYRTLRELVAALRGVGTPQG